MFTAGIPGINLQDWLYGDWDEDKLHKFEALYRIPVIGDYMDYLLDIRSDDEYLQRYGMDYSDIHDPRDLHQSNSGSRIVQSAYRMISRNIDLLYD